MLVPVLEHLEGRDSEVDGWVGQMRECCSCTTSCRDLSRADRCSGGAGYMHLQGQVS